MTVRLCFPSMVTRVSLTNGAPSSFASTVVLVVSSAVIFGRASRLKIAPLTSVTPLSVTFTTGAVLSIVNAISGETVTHPSSSVTVATRR